MTLTRRYRDYNTYLKSLYGQRVQKISVDAGLGCPNRDGTIGRGGCIYCNEKGSGTGLFSKGHSLTQQIEMGRRAMIRRYKAKLFLIYFQSYTNTYTTVEHMKALYDEALAAQGVVGMAIGTRPDCVDEEKLDLIASYNRDYLVWLEYGLQSVHDSTLTAINRGHDYNCFVSALEMAKKRKIKVCAHVILGLPGEDRKMMLESADRLGDLGIDGLKLHLLYVVKGTPMEQLFNRGEYQCLERDEYVELVCEVLEQLPGNIVIQRISADPHTDELVAPDWALDRHGNFKRIQESLEMRNTWQGRARGEGRFSEKDRQNL